MSIILLRGFSQSGKDFVGHILCQQYDYKRYAFADSLKQMVAAEFGCPIEQLHTQDGKKEICHSDPQCRTYRQILIDEAVRLRDIDADIFASACANDISKDMKHTDKKPEERRTAERIVITDWRYPNELDIIVKKFPGYKIIPVCVQRADQLDSPVIDVSEYHLVNRQNDYTILNCMNNTIHNEIENLMYYIRAL